MSAFDAPAESAKPLTVSDFLRWAFAASGLAADFTEAYGTTTAKALERAAGYLAVTD